MVALGVKKGRLYLLDLYLSKIYTGARFVKTGYLVNWHFLEAKPTDLAVKYLFWIRWIYWLHKSV